MKTKQLVYGILIFLAAVWIFNLLISPTAPTTTDLSPGHRQLFSKDLKERLSKGQLVIVDEERSDKYIQEDMSTYDLGKALTFARYKSEVLQQPLFIESQKTFKGEEHVASVTPTDRRAWQDLTLIEVELKEAYAIAHPKDLKGYSEQKALDVVRTPPAMLKFIDKYPETHIVATALAHIEYCYCIVQNDGARAIATYNELEKKYKDNPNAGYLLSLLPEYRQRAQEYRNKKLDNASQANAQASGKNPNAQTANK